MHYSAKGRGVTFARSAAGYQPTYEVRRRGPDAMIEAATQLGFAQLDLSGIEPWFYERPRWWGGRSGRSSWPLWDPGDLVRMLADGRTPDFLGLPVQVSRVEYRNRLEVVFGGSGFLILGAIYVLRLIRDWSSARRQGAAAAREAGRRARRGP
jgi:hypothetical protein